MKEIKIVCELKQPAQMKVCMGLRYGEVRGKFYCTKTGKTLNETDLQKNKCKYYTNTYFKLTPKWEKEQKEKQAKEKHSLKDLKRLLPY